MHVNVLNAVPLLNVFQDKNQLNIMMKVVSQNDEWGQLYPCLNQLAASELTVAISSVNPERDFSTMNGVRHLINNKLQIRDCLVSLNLPHPTHVF